jgi:hypothetical protein
MFGKSGNRFSESIGLIIALLVVTAIAAIYFLGHNTVGVSEANYKVVFSFTENGNTTEIRVVEPDKNTVLYENGKSGEVISLIPQNLSSVLTLPESKESGDVTANKQPTSDLTWQSTLTESSMYMNFLASRGFKVIREVHTSQFIEEILELNGIKKRIFIFNNIIMVGDLQTDVKLPDVSEYLKKYRN